MREQTMSGQTGFPKMEQKLGFGMMRLPMCGEEIDLEETCRMVDAFLAKGFCYFDTARGYIGGKSEAAVKTCLTDRYPRERYLLADKLSPGYFKEEADIRPLFEAQLQDCGVDYFDFYLMHSQTKERFLEYRRCRAYETAFALKEEGKVRHVGISFHDKAAVLEEILSAYPELEFVQLQFNYLDYEDPVVESRKCYEVCQRHKKPVIVMEPVRGGSLAALPKEAAEHLDLLNKETGKQASYASYALRYAAGFEGIFMVLSGMSNMEQMEDNLRTMEQFEALNAAEKEALSKVTAYFRGQDLIPCTACGYCLEGCPKHILIPKLFACKNGKAVTKGNYDFYYEEVYTKENGKASDCIGCGKCEAVCPQHISIRELLKEVAEEFEKKEG